jgi:rhamnosyltransferase
VVVLLHRPGDRELLTLSLVSQQDYPSSVNIMVIDSTPPQEQAGLKPFRELAHHWETIPPGSFRHGGTRNLAASRCTTPVVAYLSQDAHPSGPEWLRSLVRPLVEGQAEASYGRQSAPSPDGERHATFGYLYPEAPEIKTKDSVRTLGLRAFHFSDVTSAFLTEVIRKVSFPADLPTFEDVGVAKRLLDGGFRVAYVPDAVVLHAHSMTLREVAQRYRQIGTIYEQLGIFEELRAAGRPLLREGLRVGRRLSGTTAVPRSTRTKFASIGVSSVKLGAIACGRWEARLRRAPRLRLLQAR